MKIEMVNMYCVVRGTAFKKNKSEFASSVWPYSMTKINTLKMNSESSCMILIDRNFCSTVDPRILEIRYPRFCTVADYLFFSTF